MVNKGIILVSPCRMPKNKESELKSIQFNEMFVSKLKPYSSGWNPAEQAEERLSVIQQLIDEGYDVRIVLPTDISFSGLYDFFVEEAKKRTNNKVKTIFMPNSTQDEPDRQKLEWIADAQQQLGDKILLPPDARDDLLSQFGKASQIIKTNLGEGGLSAKTDEIALISKQMKAPDRRLLTEHNITPYVMEPPIYNYNVDMFGDDIIQKWAIDHVDLHLNVIKLQKKVQEKLIQKKLLVVNENYFEKNTKKLLEIQKNHNYKIVKIPDSESHLMPANFLKLPDGRIFVNNAPEFIKKLKEAGIEDKDIVVSKKPIIHNPKVSGSVGCFAYGVMEFKPIKTVGPKKRVKGGYKFQQYKLKK